MMSNPHGPIIVPLITPKASDDFFPLIDHVLNGGVQDLVFFGTTGEGLKFDNETKKVLLKKIYPFVKGRARLSIGLLAKTLLDAIELANFCKDLGFTSALFPPLLYGDNAEAIVAEFLQKTKMPLMLYNPPAFIGKSMQDVAPFVNEKQIFGIKDSTMELSRLPDFVKRFRSDSFRIYLGGETDLDKVFKENIDGLVPGTANVYPELLMRVWQKRDKEAFDELKEKKEYLKGLSSDFIQSFHMALKQLKVIT
jgi:dihydrodipicolinate synthase/N-acetylneuraminate lyase